MGRGILGATRRHDTAYVTSDFRDFQAGNNPKAITFFAKSFLRLHFFSTNTLTLKSSLSSTFVMQQRRGGSCNRKQTIAPPPPLPKRRTHRKRPSETPRLLLSKGAAVACAVYVYILWTTNASRPSGKALFRGVVMVMVEGCVCRCVGGWVIVRMLQV